jgi:hypothetical protein
MPGRRKSSKSTRGKSRKSARRGGGWITPETKEECVATCNNKFNTPSQGGLLATLNTMNPFASSPSKQPEEKSYLDQATEKLQSVTSAGVEPPKPSVEPPKQGGRRSRRRQYRRIKSRIRKRR